MGVFLSMPSNIASTASSDPVYDVDMLSRTLYDELEDPEAAGDAVVQRRQKMADFITKLRNSALLFEVRCCATDECCVVQPIGAG